MSAAAADDDNDLAIRHTARLMNVPESTVRMAGELRATGRDDLVAAVEGGRLALLEALNQASLEKHTSDALDGEVIPPTPNQRQRLSASDETALGEQIRAEHEAGERSLKEAVKRFRKCGELLLSAKAHMGHGYFGAFLAAIHIKPRIAQVYMKLAREWPKLPPEKAQRVAHLSLRDAIAELSSTTAKAGKLPAPSLDQALVEARHHPLKQAVAKAVNAERYPTHTPMIFTMAATVEPSSERPRDLPRHITLLAELLARTVRTCAQGMPELTHEDALEALNLVYIEIQDNGLDAPRSECEA